MYFPKLSLYILTKLSLKFSNGLIKSFVIFEKIWDDFSTQLWNEEKELSILVTKTEELAGFILTMVWMEFANFVDVSSALCLNILKNNKSLFI